MNKFVHLFKAERKRPCGNKLHRVGVLQQLFEEIVSIGCSLRVCVCVGVFV